MALCIHGRSRRASMNLTTTTTNHERARSRGKVYCVNRTPASTRCVISGRAQTRSSLVLVVVGLLHDGPPGKPGSRSPGAQTRTRNEILRRSERARVSVLSPRLPPRFSCDSRAEMSRCANIFRAQSRDGFVTRALVDVDERRSINIVYVR